MVRVYGKDGKIVCFEPPYTDDELRELESFIYKPPITVIRQAAPAVQPPDPAAAEPPPEEPHRD